MKFLKILGLAVVAAAAITAFLGVGSASATVLCKATTTPCGANVYSGTLNTSLAASTSAVFKDTSGNTLNSCTGSALKSEIKESGGASKPVVVGTTELTFSGCSATTTVINPTATLEINHVAGTDNGAVEGKGELSVKIKVGSNDCVFAIGSSLREFGTFTGGNPAAIDVHTVLPYVSGGFFCPNDVTWEGKYNVTTPAGTTIHVRAE
jgi:hypothetical protein